MIAMSAMVAAALVLRDDEVLLIRQTGLVDPTPYWSIPGGIVERGEFVHDALVREVREETGLSVAGPARLAWVSQHESPEGQLTAFGFEVTVAPGDPAPADPDGWSWRPPGCPSPTRSTGSPPSASAPCATPSGTTSAPGPRPPCGPGPPASTRPLSSSPSAETQQKLEFDELRGAETTAFL